MWIFFNPDPRSRRHDIEEELEETMFPGCHLLLADLLERPQSEHVIMLSAFFIQLQCGWMCIGESSAREARAQILVYI